MDYLHKDTVAGISLSESDSGSSEILEPFSSALAVLRDSLPSDSPLEFYPIQCNTGPYILVVDTIDRLGMLVRAFEPESNIGIGRFAEFIRQGLPLADCHGGSLLAMQDATIDLLRSFSSDSEIGDHD